MLRFNCPPFTRPPQPLQGFTVPARLWRAGAITDTSPTGGGRAGGVGESVRVRHGGSQVEGGRLAASRSNGGGGWLGCISILQMRIDISCMQLLRCNGSSDIASVLSSLQSSTQQLQVQRFSASGELKLINISWSCRYDEVGQLLDIIESGRDVTQSQQVQDELRQSELRYRTMFDSMSVGCFEIDTSALNQIFIQSLMLKLR